MAWGKLYIVATPIGNLDDMTFRAVNTLKSVEYIACEDTRVTIKLLKHFEISKKLISYHEHNKEKQAFEIIRRLEEGIDIALVTDAGTPCISDPGYYLVKEARERGIVVSGIPGACAAINALSVSGFSTDCFFFEGFLTGSNKKKNDRLKELISLRTTFVLYESPKRIIFLLQMIDKLLCDGQIFIGREMTKRYEEFLKGTPKELIDILENGIHKGEFVVVVNKPEEIAKEVDPDTIFTEYKRMIELNIDRKEAMKEIANRYGISKREVYQYILDKK